METSQISTKTIQDELSEKLKVVLEKDRSLVVLFAARCVLRVLPLLAQDERFSFWGNKQDKRAHHLLAVFYATLCGLKHNKKLYQIDSNYRQLAATYATNAFNDESTNLILAAAAKVAHASSSNSGAIEAYSLSIQVVSAFNDPNLSHANDFCALNDLQTIELGKDLLRLPLWHQEQFSRNLAYLIDSTWPNSVEKIIHDDEKVKPQRAELLKQAIDLYQKIWKGGNNEQTIDNFLAELYEYFEIDKEVESIKSSAQKNTKRATRKKTPKTTGPQAKTDNKAEQETLQSIKLTYTASRHQIAESISNHDSLNRQKLVNTLAEFLAHPNNHHHLTIGLLGDWGVGKSSVVHLLKNTLLEKHSDQPYLFAEFNAWAYEHTNNLQAGIAQEMIKALSSPDPMLASAKRWWQQPLWWMQRLKLIFIFSIKLHAKKMLKLLLMLLIALCPMLGLESISDFFAKTANEVTHTFAALGLTLWVTGFGFYFLKELHKIIATPLAKEFLTYLRLPDYGEHLGSIPVMRKQIEILCKARLKSGTSNAKRLLFVVDDLDRCGPQGIVKIFEAVRLVLDIENVMVIIAVDQRIALAAMALHYKDLAAHHQLENSRAIARDYLAKVIHLPIILKSPQKTDIQRYLNHIWDASVSVEDKKRIDDSLATKLLADLNQNKVNATNGNIDSKINVEIKTLTDNTGDKTKDAGSSTSLQNTTTLIETPQQPPIASLSESQKEAFVFWLDYFNLLNPRQVKRLNNCYNLLRSYYDDDLERTMIPSENETLKDAKNFPIMIALFVMEYLNSLESPETRTKLKKQFYYSWKQTLKENFTDEKLNADIIQIIQDASLALKINLIEAVEPFVLPAIEKTFPSKPNA